MNSSRSIPQRRRRTLGSPLAALLALVFGTGPTVGDIGSCGAPPEDLDVTRYLQVRKALDCQRCQECGFINGRCTRACDPRAPNEYDLPASCHPLIHDGEVCIDALLAASCSTYSGYVADDAPTTPSECQFCRASDVLDGGP